MKIIHCADLHLDSKMRTNLDKDKAKERRHELLDAFTRMVSFAEENDVEAILIAGDFFDTKTVSALAVNTVKAAMENHPDIAFYYLRGNHDTDGFLSSLQKKPDNLFLFEDGWTAYALGKNDSVMLYGAELLPDTSKALQESFSPDPAKINIVMLHGQEMEALAKDKSEVINTKLFRNKGINYLALGHIHEYKRGELDGYGVYCYPGCLEGRGFDECGDHGFVVLDIDEEKETVKDTFVSNAYRHLFTVEADISGLVSSPEIVEKVKECLEETGAVKEDLIKIVLSGNVDVECEKDAEYVQHFFKDDYYFVKVYDETVFKVDYEKYMLDESLKGEFVRNVKASLDLSEEEKGRIIRLGLHVIGGGKIEL